MGNILCGTSLRPGQKDVVLEQVCNVDDALSEFAESLDKMMNMLGMLLDRPRSELNDRKELSYSCPPLQHRFLQKLNTEKQEAFKSICFFLQAIRSALTSNDSSTDRTETYLKLKKQLAETYTRSDVLHAFKNSEFGYLDTYIVGLEQKINRFIEQNETLAREKKTSEEYSKEVETQKEGLVKEGQDLRKCIIVNENETLNLKDDNEYRLADMRQRCTAIEKENDNLKADIEMMRKQQNDQMSECLKQKEKLEQYIANLRKEKAEAFQSFSNEKEILLKKHNDKQNELVGQNGALTTLKNTQESRIANETYKNAKVHSQIKELFKFIQENEEGGSLLKEGADDEEKLIDSLERSLRRLVGENGSLKESNRDISAAQTSERETVEKQITDLKEENDELDAKTKELLKENISLQTTLKLQNETNAALLTEATNELDKQRKTNHEMEEALMSSKQDNQKLQADYESIKDELNKVKSAKVMCVQLYHPNRIPLVSEIENELTVLLKSEMEDGMTELEFIECKEACDIDLNIALLIVCVTASRIGTDAANIIQALKVTSKMALIMVHHKDEHALPNQESERVLTGKAFVRLGGIYDLAFLTKKGVYSCEMNLKNIKTLVYFLNKEGVRSMREDQ